VGAEKGLLSIYAVLGESGSPMSMLQDVERGAPTEIDSINGAVVREGEAVGVPTPINWALTQLVKALAYPAEATLPSPEPPAR